MGDDKPGEFAHSFHSLKSGWCVAIGILTVEFSLPSEGFANDLADEINQRYRAAVQSRVDNALERAAEMVENRGSSAKESHRTYEDAPGIAEQIRALKSAGESKGAE